MRWIIWLISGMLLLTAGVAQAQNAALAHNEVTQLGKGLAEFIAWSPDGTTLAVGGSLGVWLYDSLDTEPRLFETFRPVEQFSFADDGKVLAAIDSYTGPDAVDQVTTWDVATGKQLNTWQTMSKTNESEFSPDGNYVAVSSSAGLVTLWNVLTGQVQKEIIPFSERMLEQGYKLSFSADGSRLAIGTDGGDAVPDTIQVWNTNDGELIAALSSGFHTIDHLVLSPDGQLVAVKGLYNGINGLEIWDVNQPYSLPEEIDGLGDIAFTPDSSQLMYVSAARQIMLRDLLTGDEQVIGTFTIDDYVAAAQSYFLDNHTLVLRIEFGRVNDLDNLWIWNSESGLVTTRIGTYRRLFFRPNGQMFGYVGLDSGVHLWDRNTLQDSAILQGYNWSVRQVAYNADGSVVAAVVQTDDYEHDLLRLWNVESGQQVESFCLESQSYENQRFNFSPDGTALAYVDLYGIAHIWDIGTGFDRLTVNAHEGGVTAMAFTPDGKTFLTGGRDSTIRLWDTTTGSLLSSWQLNKAILKLIISPDGQTAVVQIGDPAVRDEVYGLELWDATTGQQREVLINDPMTKDLSFFFSPNSQHLFTFIPRFQTFIQVWSVEDGAQEQVIYPNYPSPAAIVYAKFDTTSELLATRDANWVLTQYDADSFAPIRTDARLGVDDFAFSPQGNFLATGADIIQIWDNDASVKNLNAVAVLQNDPEGMHYGRVTSLDFSPDGANLVFGSEDGAVRIWHIPDLTIGG